MSRPLVLSLIAGLAVATPVSAQLCNGSASFARTPVQLSAAYVVNDDAKSFGAGFAVGGAGPFLLFTVGKTRYPKLDGSSSDLGAGAGYQFGAADDAFHVCPLVSVVRSSGPYDVTVGSQLAVHHQIRDCRRDRLGCGIALRCLLAPPQPGLRVRARPVVHDVRREHECEFRASRVALSRSTSFFILLFFFKSARTLSS